MQALEQRAGVGDVPAHGRVGPRTLAVAVEAQVQLGQPGHGRDRRLVEPQLLQPLGDELRADHLVVVEAHAAARLEPARPRLADVVQQRGQPEHQVRTGHRAVRAGLERDRLVQHRQRVLVDVLVPVVLVDLEAQRGQLGQHVVGQPGVDEDLETVPRARRDQQLAQLVADPLGADDRDPVGHVDDRGTRGGIHREAQLGGEARGPHHAQRVVVERLPRVHGRAQDAGGEVREPVERVDERRGRAAGRPSS